MKKIAKILSCLILSIVLFSVCLGVTACRKKVADIEIELDKTAHSLMVGEEFTLKSIVSGFDGEVVWNSSNVLIATVNGGKVSALTVGSAIITANAGGKEASCAVTVTRATNVGTLSTDYQDIRLLIGGNITVAAKVTFEAKDLVGLDYTWSAADTTIVKTEKTANTCVVTALKIGTTVITVSTIHKGEILLETINVDVKNNVSISIDNLNESASGYELTLVKSKPNGYIGEHEVSFIPSISVSVENEAVINPIYTFEISAEDNLFATTSDDMDIIAVNKGKANVKIIYSVDSTAYSIDLSVNVILPEIVESKMFDLEKINALTVLSSSVMPRTATSVSIGGKAIEFANKENGVELKNYSTLNFGEYGLTIENDEIQYSAKVFVLTSLIKTKADLDMLATNSSKGENIWSGYFALANNIDYNGVFKTFCGLNQGGNWGGITGFVGTFDGRGYLIKGLTISIDSKDNSYFGGMFGVIGNEGVVKNVGFVNATVSANDASGIIADLVYGTIEDVFVEVNIQGGIRCAGIARYVLGGAKINRAVVILTGAKEANAGEFGGSNLAGISFCANNATVTNSYSVGALKFYRLGGDTPTVGIESATLKSFANMSEFNSYTFALEAYSSKIWSGDKGVPLFNSYIQYLKDNAATLAIKNNASEEVGQSFVIDGSDAFTYSVKDNKEGISINGKTVAIVGNNGETFTIIATLTYDPTIIVEKTFTVAKATEALESTYNVDLTKDISKLDISQLNGATIKSVKINNVAITYSLSGSILTLSDYLNIPYGTKTMVIETSTKNYSANVTIASFIGSADQWIGEVSSIADPANWDKHYILTANLDFTGKTYVSPKGRQYGAVFGFKGVFEGANHSVSGFTIRGVANSFFGTIALTGVVKNVAFINCGLSSVESDGTTFVSTNMSGVIADVLYGTIENIYLSYANDGHWFCAGIAYIVAETATVKNCIIEATGHLGDNLNSAFVLFKEGAKLSDIYVISTLEFPITKVGEPPVVAFPETEDICTFVDYAAFKVAAKQLDSWNENIWDISNGYPQFKTFVEAI